MSEVSRPLSDGALGAVLGDVWLLRCRVICARFTEEGTQGLTGAAFRDHRRCAGPCGSALAASRRLVRRPAGENRRRMFELPWRENATVTQLAERFTVTLMRMKKKVVGRQQAGLVTTEKVRRVRTCRVGLGAPDQERAWLERFRGDGKARFDAPYKSIKRSTAAFGSGDEPSAMAESWWP